MTVKSVNSDGTKTTTAYVFDTVIQIEHDQDGVVTNTPVLTGVSLNDHFYLLPMHVTAELAMSDSMQSFTVGQFSSGASRSVSAYQTLLNIQAQKQFVSLATRFAIPALSAYYAQMLIVSIRAQEDQQTRYAGRFWVTFQQIITANVPYNQNQTTANYDPSTDSTRPQSTANTTIGPVLPGSVSQSIQQNNNIANAPVNANLSDVPPVSGSGSWSSYPVSSGGYPPIS